MATRRSFLGQSALLGAASADPPVSRALERRLNTALDSLEIVDSHEHIIPEAERVSQPVDFFTLAGHYALNDVVSAGLSREASEKIRSPETPAAEKWRLFEPYWKPACFTGYGRALRLAIRDIYGADEISGNTLPRINDAIRSQNTPGLYRRILRDRAGIRFCVVDASWSAAPSERDLFVFARRFDRFITPGSSNAVRQLEKTTDVSITSLAGLKQAAEKSFRQAVDGGMVAVKSALAYNRELLFEEVAESDAARDFDALMRGERAAPQGFHAFLSRPYRKLEDHMFHHVVRLAEAHDLPVQIHTGLTAGNGNFLANSNPSHLTNLFFLYPKVRFDIFHIGYPYQGELSVSAKLFPNVYADFCWAHIVAPAAARRTLSDFLDTIPLNKIFAFGGDYRFPELTYAHARMARANVARVLAERVEEGLLSEDEALETGTALLRDNAARFFKR